MSKRLQVLFPDQELEHIHLIARQNGLPVSEWVRQVLREAAGPAPAASVESKVKALRTAMKHEFPTADIDDMLAEIERGYSSPVE